MSYILVLLGHVTLHARCLSAALDLLSLQ